MEFKWKGTLHIKEKSTKKIGKKTTNANKKYKENNNKMLSQFLRVNSISTNFVPGNGAKT